MTKQKHFFLTAAMLLCSLLASAHDFEVGGIYYNITSATNKTVAVTYRGSDYMTNSDRYTGAVTVPSTVTYNGVVYSVTSIGYGAFYECNGLTSITIPETVSEIGSNAFSKCGNLTRISIPSSVTSIGNFCFSSCYQLDSVVFEDGDGTLLLGNSKYSDGVGGGLFEGLYINDVYVGRNLKFSDHNDSYYRPYYNAFFAYWWATSYPIVSTVTIGPRVTELPNYMFQDCKDLTMITCMAEKVPTCYSSSFKTVRKDEGVDLGKCILYVPASSVDAYKAAEYWSEFTNIQPIPTNDIASGTCGDNLTWRLTEEYELIIEGTGDMHDFSYGAAPWYKNRESIKAVTISEGVTSIGRYACLNCNKLVEVVIPESVAAIGERAFEGCLLLPSVSIPNAVAEVGDAAFKDCYKLVSANLPEDIAYIPDWCFYNCTSLVAITIPEKVISIGESAFINCMSLANIHIPVGVTSIGDYAFNNCRSFTSVVIPDGVTAINDGVFQSCVNLASVVIPDGVVSIGKWAFYDCGVLTSVSIPECVTSIGEMAFYDCNAITAINIPEGVTEIRESVFYYCYNLTSITIPESVTSIGCNAFSACHGLTAIASEAITPPVINQGAFSGVNKSIPLYVPAGSVADYQSAEGWKEFGNFVGVDTSIDHSQLTIDHSQLIIYDLRGRRITDTANLKGVYIVNGKKVVF